MKIDFRIAALGFLWWWMETAYFGWNWTPQSNAELFADGFAFALYALAYAAGKD